MANQLLMPKATAVWLVDNTSLSFDQIANFCHLHPLEVQAIADGEAAQGIKGMDPIQTGQLSRDDIEKAEKDPSVRLKLAQARVQIPETKRKGSRYTPLSKRQERPNAILWLVRNHPELKDAQISRLVGTTKSTIEQIRNRTHWNVSNLQPVDPVTLGFCSQVDLDMELEKASTGRSAAAPEPVGDTLLSASDTQNMGLSQPAGGEGNAAEDTPAQPDKEEEFDADTVFAKLKSLKTDAPSSEEE